MFMLQSQHRKQWLTTAQPELCAHNDGHQIEWGQVGSFMQSAKNLMLYLIHIK